MSRPIRVASVMRAAALATAVALLPATTAGFAQVESRASPEFARLFATYQRIKASYVEPVEDEVLIRGAIDGMLAALDPHSAYLDGAALERLETMIEGNYQGLGISIQMEEGAVKVVAGDIRDHGQVQDHEALTRGQADPRSGRPAPSRDDAR